MPTVNTIYIYTHVSLQTCQGECHMKLCHTTLRDMCAFAKKSHTLESVPATKYVTRSLIGSCSFDRPIKCGVISACLMWQALTRKGSPSPAANMFIHICFLALFLSVNCRIHNLVLEVMYWKILVAWKILFSEKWKSIQSDYCKHCHWQHHRVSIFRIVSDGTVW